MVTSRHEGVKYPHDQVDSYADDVRCKEPIRILNTNDHDRFYSLQPNMTKDALNERTTFLLPFSWT